MHCSFSMYEDFGVEISVLLKVFLIFNKWLQDLRRERMLLNAWIGSLNSPSIGFSIIVYEDCCSLWISKLLSFFQAIWPLRPKIKPLKVFWLKNQGWKTSHFCLSAIFELAWTPLSRLAWCFKSAPSSSSWLGWTVQTSLLCSSQLYLLQVSSDQSVQKSWRCSSRLFSTGVGSDCLS